MANKKSNKTDDKIDQKSRLVEDLFNDFYKNRRKVYLFNLIRGMMFGFGSVLGGTVFIAILVWILSQIAGFFPSIGDSIHNFIVTLQR